MRSVRWWLLSLFLGLAAAQGCSCVGDTREAVLTERQTMPDSMNMICPKTWDWTVYREGSRSIQLQRYPDFARFLPEALEETRIVVPVDTILVQVDTVFLSGPGETQNTAEFHDCQAFVTNQGSRSPGSYSEGIFAIFAVRRGTRAVSSDLLFRAAADGGMALPAAQVFALASYAPLGVEPGFSCLYLLQQGEGFEARLRRDGWDEQDCRDAIPISEFEAIPIPDGANLSVTYVDPRPRVPDTIPVVARWHWSYDSNQGAHVYRMGVWCDQWWCEVGRVGMPTPEEEPITWNLVEYAEFSDGTPILATNQGRVPGWYDEQVLSVYRDGALAVSGIIGTLFPEPSLGLYTLADYASSRWQPAAKVALTSPAPAGNPSRSVNPQNPFTEKFNFDFTTEGSPLNSVSLCRGGWDDCREDGAPDLPPACHPAMVHTDTTSEWWAKLEAPPQSGRDPMYSCVARCPYDFQVAGTARWRWLPDDPGLWMRCIDGCCEVRGKH